MTTYHHAYRANPLVRLKQQQGRTAAQNSLTGIAYQLSPATLEIFQFIRQRERTSLADVAAAFPAFSEADLASVLDYFHANKLLFTGQPEDLDAITRKDVTFFDLSDKPQAGALTLVGIPFGAGNPLPNSCSSAPDNLRLQIREKKLSLRAGSVQCNEVTNDLFGIAEDYAFSEAAFEHTRDLGNMFLNVQHESSVQLYERIYRVARGLFADTVPFFIGGDHSVSYSTIRAAAEHHNNLCVIQFDAHTDTYASAKSLLAEEGMHNHGNFINKCLQLDAVKKVYQLGIRGGVNMGQSRAGAKRHIIPGRQLQRLINAQTLQLDIPADCKIYITIDIDVLDPLVAPATASPVPGGLQEDELLRCLQYLYDTFSHQIIGFDLVEVSPHLFKDHQATATVASHILLQIIQRFSHHAKQ